MVYYHLYMVGIWYTYIFVEDYDSDEKIFFCEIKSLKSGIFI